MIDSTFNRVCDLLAMSETLSDFEMSQVVANEPEYVLLDLIPLVTSLNLMRSLAQDRRNRIRRELTGNSYLTKEILELLSQGDDGEMLFGVAIHSAIEERLLIDLSKHSNADARYGAASNPRLPISELYRMLDDKSATVSSTAVSMLKTRPDSDYFDLPESFKDHGLKMLSVKNCPSEISSIR